MSEGKKGTVKIVEIKGKGFDPETIGLDDIEKANNGEFPGLSTEVNEEGEVVPVITYIKKEED